ncbi:MAG TPA: creatininase family protein [bacterium]|nr:creatininase family protein [bacterium]
MAESVRDRAVREYRYEALTWQEINEAVALKKVVILPVGATEQHGHHLPLDTDTREAASISLEAGRRSPAEILVLPAVAYGYTHHVMDFPGTINVEPATFVCLLVDIGRSAAYHGFKRIVILNGHGSNQPLVETAARQVTLQTDASCMSLGWWQLAGKYWNSIRTSGLGGSAHACEMETSLYWHIDPDGVRTDRIRGDIPSYMSLPGADRWHYRDITLGSGPAGLMDWTSSFSETGSNGLPQHATPEKGRLLFEHVIGELIELVRWFRLRPDLERRDRHAAAPTFALPFGF